MRVLRELSAQVASRYRTAPEVVAEVLREAILRGMLRAGNQLRQDELASQLGVSRIPIREALRQLDAEGLVKFLPHRGVVVSGLSVDGIQEIYEIRIALESTALRLSLPHLTDEDLSRAQEVLGELDRVTDITRWIELNRDFHTLLYAAARRPRLLALIDSMRANVNRYMYLYISLLNYQPRSQEEHRRILEAVKRRDADAAVKALEHHLGEACRELVAYFPREDEGPPDGRRVPHRSGPEGRGGGAT